MVGWYKDHPTGYAGHESLKLQIQLFNNDFKYNNTRTSQ